MGGPGTGGFCVGRADAVVYSHGGYVGRGEAVGHFGWSVRKGKKGAKHR